VTKQALHSPRSAADRAVAEQLLAAARSGADVRTHKVRRLKSAIRSRRYENDLKLSVAVDRLLNAVRPERRA
jgi:hypothetical protein